MSNQSPKAPNTFLTIILVIIVLVISGVGIFAIPFIRSNNESEERIAESIRLSSFPTFCTGDIGFSGRGKSQENYDGRLHSDTHWNGLWASN